ncbi:hypothetical protein BOTCAL_0153g00160 [Botryotinia calthae]|uniref:Uncharacterized protein n=1 Tax=Botryotinia calthae TaxID=38488 RepID=A0A4Y8D257_9HELO|nr:hypothetical protein BOTCAL_0153g00160 [Botryotinia calthae]
MSGAEAAFIIGVISSVISIIEATKKVYDAAGDAKGQPEAFRQVAARLPLVIEILRSAELRLPSLNETALDAIENTLESCKAKAESLNKIFHKVLRKNDDKFFDRYKKAIGTLGKTDKVESLMEGILKDTQLLACEKLMGIATESQVNELEGGIKEMEELSSRSQENTGTAALYHYGSGSNNANTGGGAMHTGSGDLYHNNITGDAHFGSNPYNQIINNHIEHHVPPAPLPPLPSNYELGLCFSGAPLIDNDIFVGREMELKKVDEWLSSDVSEQNIVAIYGLGGMGKTQFSIHFAKRHRRKYSAIIWLNAKNEDTLTTAFLDLWDNISGAGQYKLLDNQLDKEIAIRNIRKWFSEPENNKWLVIFDSYNDPQLPGIQNSNGYDIRKFFPYKAQGSILITTRSSKINLGKQLQLGKFVNIDESLAILANHSGKKVTKESDVDARKLAERLDGLPLALATAGAYISQTADSFGSYIQLYENRWNELAQNSEERLEYADRTLYTTWNVSLKQVEAQNPEARQMLQLFAYLDNTDIWYELFLKVADSGPIWLSNIVKSKVRFDRAMSKLREYSLIEVETEGQSGRYSLHTCVHDWTLGYLNLEIDAELYSTAISIIARNTMWDKEPDFWTNNRRLGQHATRLDNKKLKNSIDWGNIDPKNLFTIAYLNSTIDRLLEAEEMYQRVLQGYEKAWGLEDASTLGTVNNLGIIYKKQGKMTESEEMFQRALKGKEKLWGPEHISTLNTVNNLGFLYLNQGKMIESEEMFQRALEGYEKSLGPEHERYKVVKQEVEALQSLRSMNNLLF